jgi:hypothetical protein
MGISWSPPGVGTGNMPLLGWSCGSTGGGGLAGMLGWVALASVTAPRARRAPDAKR